MAYVPSLLSQGSIWKTPYRWQLSMGHRAAIALPGLSRGWQERFSGAHRWKSLCVGGEGGEISLSVPWGPRGACRLCLGGPLRPRELERWQGLTLGFLGARTGPWAHGGDRESIVFSFQI